MDRESLAAGVRGYLKKKKGKEEKKKRSSRLELALLLWALGVALVRCT